MFSVRLMQTLIDYDNDDNLINEENERPRLFQNEYQLCRLLWRGFF